MKPTQRPSNAALTLILPLLIALCVVQWLKTPKNSAPAAEATPRPEPAAEIQAPGPALPAPEA
ncbi:MAG: hypothetical protein LDL31_03950 [Prosthecobacter sp.]|nr:hypothetical protein [Prosthecobacter sp.]